ncbi:MAG: hypothetical protein AAB932_04345, partial [Patescibacteria group bacterium]
MDRHHEKTGAKRFVGSRLFLLIILASLGMLVFLYVKEYYQDYKIRREIETLRESVSGLEREKLESMEILKYVMSTDFVEEQARTQ